MSLQRLAELHAALGLAAPDPQRVELRGADPVLATRFRVGEAAAAALAACALAAAELWRLRGGREQRVAVDLVGAAASLLGFAWQRLEDPSAAAWEPRGQLTDFYPTRDGRWFLFHQSFPDTQARALARLGCGPEREALAAAIAGWDAQALEDAIAEIGCCGARVRSVEEWAGHAQGRALAERPVVEVIRVGDSPAEPLARAGERPLSGVRALDLTRVLAGPTCGRTLAAHGAEVLRIGSPKLPFVAPFVMDTSHGKRSAFLDLRDPVDAERLRALVRGADVFTQGYRSGALARLGFGPEQLFALRPGLVYTAINCYGHVGPWTERPGWEQLAQTVTGIASEHGGAERPRLLPAAATDYNTGYLAALGTMIALARRAREGGSYLVRASLVQTGMWIARMPRTDSAGPGLSAEQVRPFLTRSDTPFGPLTHLGPIVEMAETPARWATPTVPLGTHPPEWLA
ncbi:MAG TPA: CoA transferase [Myxococcota bacterium]|nr:CoA transferase [Myxococcota bacterium]